MKGLAIAWTMLVAIVVSVFAIWAIINGAGPWFVPVIMIVSSGGLFALAAMLMKGYRW